MSNDWFAQAFAEEIKRATKHVSDRYGVDVDVDRTPITVKRMASFVPMSIEMLLDAGVITEEEARARGWTPTPPVKVSRWQRARWRWQSWRERAGRWLGSKIAGVDLSEREDDY